MQIYSIRHIVYAIIIICLFSCESTETTQRKHTYFGGEIINPNSNYVLLYKTDVFCDTIYLNKKNQFLYKIENLTSGLYYFTHTPERQLVLLEKGDSILLRLNTLEFDESLVYTGDGAKKNNFLIDLFLENEKEMIKLKDNNFTQSFAQFKKNQDSLLNQRIKTFNDFTTKNQLSDLAKHITKSNFIYDFYSRNEIYFYKKYQKFSDIGLNNLPSSFFDYRKEVNFNDKEIMSMFSYNFFLNLYFTNSTYIDFAKEHRFNLDSDDYTIHSLNHVDCLINLSFLKNNLLKSITEKYLTNNDNILSSKKILKHYLSLSSNEIHKKEITNLVDHNIPQKKTNFIIPE